MLQTTEKQELEVAFKKQYSILKQAIWQIKNEEGLDFSFDSYGSKFKKILASKYITLKDCGAINNNTGCVITKENESFNHYKGLLGNLIIRSYFDDGGFVANDGTAFFLEQGAQAKEQTGYLVSIDINGYSKGPNIMGKDFFMFQITTDGEVLPMGAPNTYFYDFQKAYCSKKSTNSMNGYTCAYYAVTDKDYFKKL